MRLRSPSNLGADFGFVVLLAAMLAVAAVGFLGAGDPPDMARRVAASPQAMPRPATEVVDVVPYRVDVVGVRTRHEARIRVPDAAAGRRPAG
jgi:hypothetical protein